MRYNFTCDDPNCGYEFEAIVSIENCDEPQGCPRCGRTATRQFNATSNVFIPPYFMTMKSDIFTDLEWRKLKDNPNIERLR